MLKDATLETKSAAPDDITTAFDGFMRAFEAFKDANDERLGQLERRMAADVVTADKVDRLDRALDAHKRLVDDLALKAQRPHLGGPAARSGVTLQHKAAFDVYVRKGEAAALRDLEAKALSVGTGTDGGYLVPDEVERAVNRAVRDVSPIRAIAGIRQVSGLGLSQALRRHRRRGRLGGRDGRADRDRQPHARRALRDVLPDHGALRHAGSHAGAARRQRRQHRRVDRRRGARQLRPAGRHGLRHRRRHRQAQGLRRLHQGRQRLVDLGQHRLPQHRSERRLPTASATVAPGDKLIDLVYAVKAGYRGNGTFVFNRATQAVIRKMKDAEGHYLWQPATKAGDPSLVLGYPVAESEDMPSLATDSYSVAFGDFRCGYLIVDRVGIRVLRDPYSQKPYVLFYTTKRVGGGVQDFNAIKLLKFAA